MEMTVQFIVLFFLSCFGVKGVTLLQVDNEEPVPNIIGGEFAKLKELPYQVGVFAGEYKWRKSYLEDFKIEENFHFCGGSIISHKHVLSAASCFVDTCDGYIGGQVCVIKKHSYIMAGIVDKTDEYQKRLIKSVDKNEDYGHRRLLPAWNSYDIALITVKEPFTFDDRVKPVQLAMELPPCGTECTVSGWGPYEDSDVPSTMLKKAKYDMGFQLLFSDRIVFPPSNLKTGIIKTVDSGGPLVCDGKLVAIISDNKITIPESILWKAKIFDILTSVVNYLAWLEKKGVKIGGGYD